MSATSKHGRASLSREQSRAGIRLLGILVDIAASCQRHGEQIGTDRRDTAAITPATSAGSVGLTPPSATAPSQPECPPAEAQATGSDSRR